MLGRRGGRGSSPGTADWPALSYKRDKRDMKALKRVKLVVFLAATVRLAAWRVSDSLDGS